MKTVEEVYGQYTSLETERLLIRRLTSEDASAIFHYASDPSITGRYLEILKCHECNLASSRVMEKAGMTYEGLLREALFVKGMYWNLRYYAILRSDWEKEK